jgi:murein DD-endopeptidase MepM/ murein hydrolase activator NlpD
MTVQRVIFAILASFLLASCITGGSDRAPAPVSLYGAGAGAGSAGIHTVSSGETLWSISQRYNMSMRDIIHENKLSAPYMLGVGQRLKLPPPREYMVKAGDTLYGVSRLFNVSVNEIARINDLDSPYTLQRGQVLRLPSVEIEEEKESAPVRVASSKSAPAPVPQQRPATGAQQKQTSAAPSKTPVTTAPPKRSGSRFKWPVNGTILSSYGPKKDGLHNDGINIKAPKGAPVRAAENGVVVYAGNELQGYGNLVLVRHENRWMTAYAHLDKVMIKRGQTVNMGETIGTVGSSGSVDTPQLHFEVRRGTEALNPKRYLE